MADHFTTLRLCDGTTVTLRTIATGPSGVISAPRLRPTLYLWHAKHSTYYRVPQDFTEDDLPALEERIQRPHIGRV